MLAAGILALLVPACSQGREWTGRGEVVAIDEPRLHVTIRHEAMPGLMEPMTMRFAVASQAVLDGIAPGDPVSFVLLQRGSSLTLLSVTRPPAAQPSVP